MSDQAQPQADPSPKPDSTQDTEVESASVTEPASDVALDSAGRERPQFLLAFPADPALQRLSAAFEAGNYALVRAEAEALAERTEDADVKAAALELRRRIEPDPLAKYLLALTAALLLFLAYVAYHH